MSDPREVVTDDGRFGVTDGDPKPIPNKADAAFAELQTLRAEARKLGLEGADREPLATLRARVEAARADRG
jgi:hypothetical protein